MSLCSPTHLATDSAASLQTPVQTRAFATRPSLLPFAVQPAVENQDVVAMGAAFLLALVWVRLWDELVNRGVIDSVSCHPGLPPPPPPLEKVMMFPIELLGTFCVWL